MGTHIKIPFGLSIIEGKIMHISQVDGGLKCECVCPNCKSVLVAHKGEKTTHHFKHYKSFACNGALESAIHLAAKQIIKEKMEIKIPEYKVTIHGQDFMGYDHQLSKETPSCTVKFSRVEEELTIESGQKIDIVGFVNKIPLYIEIYYSHKVDDEKIEKIKNKNISMIEIDLSDIKIDQIHDWSVLWDYITDTKRINWLNNRKHELIELNLKERIRLIEDC
jgi:hypothetical protein